MKISNLYIYPIKSFGGIAVKEAKAMIRGFEHDRRWMLVDENGRFISQREHPNLALWKSQVEQEDLKVTNRATNQQITIKNAFPKEEPDINVSVWKDSFRAKEVGKEANKVFSDLLSMHCRLVYMNQASIRRAVRQDEDRGEVSFADGYPYLVATIKSMEALSAAFGQTMDILRFRPNIVIENDQAWEEDFWASIESDRVRLTLPKACVRCQVPGIDPQTGETNADFLKVLARERRMDKKVIFGINAKLDSAEGMLQVGELLQINLK